MISRRNDVVASAILMLGLGLVGYNVYELRRIASDLASTSAASKSAKNTKNEAFRDLTYSVYAKNPDSGYLKHVYAVLERGGYRRVNYNSTSDWDLMWAHDYPFKKLKPMMEKMKKGQRVNKIPGSGFVTNKVNLATSDLPHVPKAFRLPDQVDELHAYVEANPDKMFVQKNKNHRGIKIEKISKLDLTQSGSFIQEFVDRPLLIDGYKFDIGIYTMITSIDPLRIYVFDGDLLLRFCPEKYHPFDPANRDKYVVHDDYRPTWEVPTMAKIYSDLGYSFKETLIWYIRNMKMADRSPDQVWEDMYEVIRKVYLDKLLELRKSTNKYSVGNAAFFEMVRFDFVLDQDLNVYLMEANMSPNLSSKHFPPNRLLYEQVLYTLFRLAGIIKPNTSGADAPSKEMLASDKDLFTHSDLCSSEECSKVDSCRVRMDKCGVCKQCLSAEEKSWLRAAFLEHTNRHSARRIFPKSVDQSEARSLIFNGKSWRRHRRLNESDSDYKQDLWFAGKCAADLNWCN